MKIEHLRTFLSVCHTRSFTDTAREIHRTQPAVSRQVRLLESDLGVRLVEQVGRRLELTDAGRALEADAGAVVGDLERLRESVQRFAEVGPGRLRVGASTTPGALLIPPVVGHLRSQVPGLELDIAIDNSTTICRGVVDNTLDVAVVGSRPRATNLVVRTLCKDEIVCLVAPGHPLAGRRNVPTRDLGNETWIAREWESGTRQHVQTWLQRKRALPKRILELANAETIQAFTATGMGMAFLSRRHPSALVPVDLADTIPPRTLYLVRHADKQVSPNLRRFVDLLEAHVRG